MSTCVYFNALKYVLMIFHVWFRDEVRRDRVDVKQESVQTDPC